MTTQEVGPSTREEVATGFAMPGRRSAHMAKRALDVAVSGLSLVVLSPVFALIAVAIKATSDGPVLFKQERIGQDEVPFQLYKFRTMVTDNSDAEHRAFVTAQIEGSATADTTDGAFKLDDPRVTSVGSFLRRFSIDELPQLANVFNGTMSLVGPRPSLDWEIELYRDEHRRRAAAVPGCSGLWQVSGRNRLSTNEMLDLDLEYVDNWSLLGDLSILLRTLPAVIRGDGAR